MIVINKPPHLLVIPDHWDAEKPNVLTMLQLQRPGQKIYVVHRLDEGTSGIVLFAKDADTHRALSQQFESRQVLKTYLAIVNGRIMSDGVIELDIGPDERRKGLMTVRKGEKTSVTEYQVVERFRRTTLVSVKPRTGRTHQIRVHFQAIGHPLVVDPDYGGGSAIYLSSIKPRYKAKLNEEERPLIDRLTLHASELRFHDPATGDDMHFTIDLPKDMRALLNALRKYQ